MSEFEPTVVIALTDGSQLTLAPTTRALISLDKSGVLVALSQSGGQLENVARIAYEFRVGLADLDFESFVNLLPLPKTWIQPVTQLLVDSMPKDDRPTMAGPEDGTAKRRTGAKYGPQSA